MGDFPRIIGGGAGIGEKSGIGKKLIGSTYSVTMGKGLKEPCSPWRTANVFGAALNTPNASGWNCVPYTEGETRNFDLSSITPNHEVVVALSVFYGLEAGYSPWVSHVWYRARDSKYLYGYNYRIPDPYAYGYDYWIWYYIYSYIGYVSWEIWENGSYYDKIVWDNSELTRLNFNVTGIPVAEETQFQGLVCSYARFYGTPQL